MALFSREPASALLRTRPARERVASHEHPNRVCDLVGPFATPCQADISVSRESALRSCGRVFWGRATKRTERAASTATPDDGVREGVVWITLRRVDESRAAAVKRERAPNGSHNREQDRQCFSDRLTSYRAESAELELRYHPSATTASREG